MAVRVDSSGRHEALGISTAGAPPVEPLENNGETGSTVTGTTYFTSGEGGAPSQPPGANPLRHPLLTASATATPQAPPAKNIDGSCGSLNKKRTDEWHERILENPEEAMPQQARKYLKDIEETPEKIRFIRLMREYKFVPQSYYEADMLAYLAEFLDLRPVKEFFRFLVERVGYSFELSFIKDISNTIGYKDLSELVEFMELSSNLRVVAGGSADKDEETRKSLKSYAHKLVEFRLKSLKTLLDAPEFGEALCNFQLKYGAFEPTVAALLFLSRNLKGDTPPAETSTAKVESETGNLFAGNEMFLILLSAYAPSDYDKLKTTLGSLKLKRNKETLTIETVSEITSLGQSGDFVDFWNWSEEHFLKYPLEVSHANRLANIWKKFEESMAPTGDSRWTRETADLIKTNAERIGFKVGVNMFVDHGAEFFWPEEDIVAIERLKKLYPIDLDKTDPKDLHLTVKEIISGGLLDKLADEREAPFITAITGAQGKDSKVELAVIVNAMTVLQKMEVEMPGSYAALKRLFEAGVSFDGFLSQARDANMEGLGDFFSRILKRNLNGITRSFIDRPSLTEKLEETLKLYRFDGKIAFEELSFFTNISDGMISAMNLPEVVREISFLQNTYEFRVSLTSIIDYAQVRSSKGEEQKELAEGLGLLKTTGCRKFYAGNKDLFAQTGPTNGRKRAVLIGQAFKLSSKNAKWIGWVRKYLALSPEKTFNEYLVAMGDEISVLDDPRFERFDRALQKFGFKELTHISKVGPLLEDIDTIEERGFGTFFEMCFQSGFFNFKFVATVADILKLYKDPDKRAFLEDKKVREFHAKIKDYGYEFSEAKFGEFKSLYETNGLIATIEELGRQFESDIKSEVKGILSMGIFGISTAIIRGIYTREYNFIMDIKTAIDSGDIRLVIGREAAELYKYCRDNYNYKFSVLDLSSWISVMKSKRLRDAVRDPRNKEALQLINGGPERPDSFFEDEKYLKFDFNMLPFLTDIAAHQEEFEWVLEMLEKQFGYERENAVDIMGLADLIGRHPVFERLASPQAKKLVEDLVKKHGYSFGVKDIYSILYLLDHPQIADAIYDDQMNSMAESVMGISFGDDLAGRIEFYLVYKDPVKRRKISSDAFRETRETFSTEFNVSGGVNMTDGYLLLMDHPEVAEFLRKIGYSPRDWDISRYFCLGFVPGLVKMASNGTEKYIASLRSTFGEDIYAFNPSDGFAWDALVNKYPDPQVFVEAFRKFKERYEKETFSVNDIYIGLVLGENFSTDRKALESEISESFGSDLHRTDSNFDSYTSYNDPSRLTLTQLNKAVLLKKFLDKPETRNSIGTHIHKDVEDFYFTELGMVVVLNPDGSIGLRLFQPELNLNNGSYSEPQEARDLLSQSLGDGHQHALKFEGGYFAGPSGGRAEVGGDISVAQVKNIDSFVVTSISKKSFAVHFYTPGGNVVFLGLYEYDL